MLAELVLECLLLLAEALLEGVFDCVSAVFEPIGHESGLRSEPTPPPKARPAWWLPEGTTHYTAGDRLSPPRRTSR